MSWFDANGIQVDTSSITPGTGVVGQQLSDNGGGLGAPPAGYNNTPVAQPNGTSGSPNPYASSAMPAGMSPQLAAIYQNSGLNPAGRGSGFADWQYWQDVGPSQYGRLAADIAGTGTDQPTGTPGQGAWSNSGRNALPGGGGSVSGSSSQGSTTGGGPVNMPTAPTYTPFNYTGAAPSYTDFVAPTSVTEQNDPGYQFRAQQQQQALDNSAAAKGMSHTNNTWQALQDQSGQLASQEYGNVYNRAFGTNQANNAGQLGAQQANYGQQFNANQALNAGQLANYGAQTNAALGLGNLNLGYQNSANSYALGQGSLGVQQGQLGLAQSGQAFNQGLALDQNAFGQQLSVAQLGNPGAPNSQGFGTTQGSTLEGQGNATAAGQVGSANAYTGALGTIGNAAQQASYMAWLNSQGKSA